MDRFDELAVFLAILDAGSLAKAGKALRRSPSALSRVLSGLEERLGARLVERTTRSLAATEQGRALADRARRLLADYGEAMQQAMEGPLPRGLIRITAPVVFGGRHVTPVVNEFLARYAQVRIDLVLHDGNLDLVEHELDVAIRIGPLRDSSLVARRVGAVRRILVASPAYLAQHGMPRTVEALADHEVIAIAALQAPAEWRFSVNGSDHLVRTRSRLTVNQVEAGLEAARAGHGIVRPLSYQVADDLASGRLVRLLDDCEPRPLPVHLLVPSRRHMTTRVRAFLDLAAERLGGLAALKEAA
jgi:DNA-binding transcriptional LysR family regulator